MTRAEKVICKEFLNDADHTHSCNEYKLLMDLLEQEPCNNAVSREDVIKAVDRHTFDTDDGLCLDEDITVILEELSPVKPVACIAKVNFSKEDMQEIVDKKVKELEMEKHTDRQIYVGCIHLMLKMVDYFREYLEYLGYDLDKLDEDERFAVEVSNMEIVRWLFLLNTRNSGGCSVREFCGRIGIDYSEYVKFEFERDEEE